MTHTLYKLNRQPRQRPARFSQLCRKLFLQISAASVTASHKSEWYVKTPRISTEFRLLLCGDVDFACDAVERSQLLDLSLKLTHLLVALNDHTRAHQQPITNQHKTTVIYPRLCFSLTISGNYTVYKCRLSMNSGIGLILQYRGDTNIGYITLVISRIKGHPWHCRE